jgi:hypothetical protein
MPPPFSAIIENKDLRKAMHVSLDCSNIEAAYHMRMKRILLLAQCDHPKASKKHALHIHYTYTTPFSLL